MKKTFLLVVICLIVSLTLPACVHKQPSAEDLITFSDVPQATVKMTSQWKMGEFTVGYRIITDQYVVTSGYGGLFGQEGQSLGGPGLVNRNIIESFGNIISLTETAKKK